MHNVQTTVLNTLNTRVGCIFLSRKAIKQLDKSWKQIGFKVRSLFCLFSGTKVKTNFDPGIYSNIKLKREE